MLFWQIDPSERLDPDVEDILVDIAEDFVESVSSWIYSLLNSLTQHTLAIFKDVLCSWILFHEFLG